MNMIKRNNKKSRTIAISLRVSVALMVPFICSFFWSQTMMWKFYFAEMPPTESSTALRRPSAYQHLVKEDRCATEFERVNQDQVPGLTEESLSRSRAWIGNKERLYKLARSLKDHDRPLNIVVSGGSITKGHGIHDSPNNRYSAQLEQWFNKFYPSKTGVDHKVHNIGAHGADMCNIAKRMHKLLNNLATSSTIGTITPDLFILEFAVNDYQGQDDKKGVDMKFDVFFDGFQDIALCSDIVVNKLVRSYPNAPVMFMEFRTAIPSRKTAQLLHLGVAQHYEIQAISYAEAMYPEYSRLISLLNVSDGMSAPKPVKNETSTVLPYPYGCVTCRPDDIDEGFRKGYCKSVCKILSHSNYIDCDENQTPLDRQKCYPAIFAHDCVHPSKVGHSIAKDLIVHAISSAVREECEGKTHNKHVLPKTGWLLDSPLALLGRASFDLVQDTLRMYDDWDRLEPVQKTAGWSYYSDTEGNAKPGWISTNATGNEVISFDINLPFYKCYAVYVAVLRSYENMGKFTVEVQDLLTNKTTSIDGDGLWKARISVWSDTQITKDDDPACTGKCRVNIHTHPEIQGRGGNKVKVLTLSARKCQ